MCSLHARPDPLAFYCSDRPSLSSSSASMTPNISSVLIGACLCLACAPSPQIWTFDAADPRVGDVVRAEGARFAAMKSRDFAALDTLLADDLAYTHSSGETDTKTSLVAALREGRLVYVAIAPRDL